MSDPLVLPAPQALFNLVGRELAVTDWFELSQDRIQQFADATDDRQWIHVDPERARRESPYRATIAHGFLTLSLLSHLKKEALQITGGVGMAINYGLNRVRFPSPVSAGSRIRAHFTVKSVKDVSNAVEAVFFVKVEVQGEMKPCCVAEWIVRYYLPSQGTVDAV
ncbi:MAG TPA: MaoC family dehydratase [Candidatus Acidoferrum sp.]|nr:MaoC family dehydratase [Candidatus Acidoferrum sp.]